MKFILGDNQFFGVNHFDLEKGAETKRKSEFSSREKISDFISAALSAGMDGFMMNSNDDGYHIISEQSFDASKEIQYSILICPQVCQHGQ